MVKPASWPSTGAGHDPHGRHRISHLGDVFPDSIVDEKYPVEQPLIILGLARTENSKRK